MDIICRSYTKSNHADHERQGFDSISFKESSSGLFNSLNNTICPILRYAMKVKLFLAALQKYRLGKQSGKDIGEGCKDGMIATPLYRFSSYDPFISIPFAFPCPRRKGHLEF
jgi:hypothetical protein